MSYEAGIVVALILYIFSIIMTIHRKYSKINRNFNKIGYRIGWDGNTKPLYKKSSGLMIVAKILLILFGFVFIFFSWLYVVLVGGYAIYQLYSSLTAPPEVKRFRWKMKNVDMSFDEIVRELMITQNMDLANFDEFRKECLDEMKCQIEYYKE